MHEAKASRFLEAAVEYDRSFGALLSRVVRTLLLVGLWVPVERSAYVRVRSRSTNEVVYEEKYPFGPNEAGVALSRIKKDLDKLSIEAFADEYSVSFASIDDLEARR